MPTGTCPSRHTSGFNRRLGPHHFAYLRAIAEGLDRQDCARRYLGIEHGHEAVTAHGRVVDQVRAAARRRGEASARLIGLTIRLTNPDQPSLEDFSAERGLDGWSEAEVAELYAAEFGPDPKAQRRERLRQRQIELLRRLEYAVAEAPSPTDFVGGWFDEVLARKLVAAGFITLGALNARVSAGGAWYKTLPAVGQAKAQRIEAFLRTLLPREAVALPLFTYPLAAARAGTGKQENLKSEEPKNRKRQTGGADAPGEAIEANKTSEVPWALEPCSRLDGSGSRSSSLLGSITVEESVSAWIGAKAQSVATRRVYAREVGRFLVWLHHERPGTSPAHLTVQDAVAFAQFLQGIPAHYMSRRQATPGEPGWAPFRGPLTPGSRRQALVVVSSWLDWLVAARHLEANPFALISKQQGDDRAAPSEVKAIGDGAMQALLGFFDAASATPAAERMRFVLRFLEATGLRASELVQARLSDLRMLPEGLALQVHGKGAKNRHVPLTRQAREALDAYLASRGVGNLSTAPGETPLLASTRDPMAPIGYPALHQTLKRWLAKAVSASALPRHEQLPLYAASTHWLRHTFGTRAIERGATPDAVQATMGHSSPAMLARYTRASAKRQFSEMGKVFGE